MKAGIEVHQQLATHKLFCDCPSTLTELTAGSFTRRLRAASGEDHQIDPAAAFEASRDLLFRYESGPETCLVEADEEPPHELNSEALEVALTLALLLHARPVDEIEVMRKIVVDGSNTSGFQRTALVAADGWLEVGGKRYSIPSICLEEDAARKVTENRQEVTYRLDRLGIPLIEISTGPEIASGTEAREVAEEIGALLRATGKVRRGIGTIREDLNVSVEGGARVEIKGVQELRLIHRYVDGEAERQTYFVKLRERLPGKNVPEVSPDAVDVTNFDWGNSPGVLRDAARKGGHVLALALRGFAGYLGTVDGKAERLGRELADHARTTGVRGIIHSDELPGFGLEAVQIVELRRNLHLGEADAFVLVADPNEARGRAALRLVAERAQRAREGVPPETRDPLPNGQTRYSRPLPGRDRMYPETDVPPIPISTNQLDRLSKKLPPLPTETRERLAAKYNLPVEVVRQLQGMGEIERFEELSQRGRPPALVARLLMQDLPGVVDRSEPAALDALTVDRIDELLAAVERGEFAKEGIPLVLAEMAAGPLPVDAAVKKVGFAVLSEEELGHLTDHLIEQNEPLVRARGMDAFSALMGDLMREVRGRRDGQEVARVLREKLTVAVHRPADEGIVR